MFIRRNQYQINRCVSTRYGTPGFHKHLKIVKINLEDITRCFLNKMKNEIVKPLNPIFYKRLIDDTYSRRKKNQQDILYDK